MLTPNEEESAAFGVFLIAEATEAASASLAVTMRAVMAMLAALTVTTTSDALLKRDSRRALKAEWSNDSTVPATVKSVVTTTLYAEPGGAGEGGGGTDGSGEGGDGRGGCSGSGDGGGESTGGGGGGGDGGRQTGSTSAQATGHDSVSNAIRSGVLTGG